MKENQQLNNLKSDIIATAREILRYDTVKSAPAENSPFGEGNAKCLDYVLNKCRELGMTTYNCDYYAGHADYGSGETLGIIGHLDVVPADEKNWIQPPFAGNMVGDTIYGRGALDDKVPMVACMYAVKALIDSGYSFKRRVRLIFGCDEESGMECAKYYFTKMPKPDMGFSPDADFPIINREKGIMGVTVNCGKLNSDIIDITAGLRSNVVPDECTAKLVGKFVLPETVDYNDNITTVATKGKSAHGSLPQKGDNAAWKMFALLNRLFPDDEAVAFALNRIADYTGTKWGINLNDQPSGDLTANIGVVRVVDGELILTVDIRHPVTFTSQQVTKLVEEKGDGKAKVMRASSPLYVPEDTPLVQALLKAYHEATGRDAYTVAIGGGTYSRCMNNCVAFGPEFPGDESIIHQPNECITVDRLMEITGIYMQAIKALCIEC